MYSILSNLASISFIYQTIISETRPETEIYRGGRIEAEGVTERDSKKNGQRQRKGRTETEIDKDRNRDRDRELVGERQRYKMRKGGTQRDR